MSKFGRKRGINNKKWELTGDSILRLVVAENIKKISYSVGPEYLNIYQSNVHLKTVTIPMKFHKFKIPGNAKDKKRNEVKGDMVEYYIAFLYYNYGLDSARRFIKRKILKL